MTPPAFLPRDPNLHPPALTPAYKTSVLRSPGKSLVALEESLSELTGPVFGQEGLGEHDADLITNYALANATGGEPIGERIIVHGRVLDEAARPVAGALVEVWQANAGGRYRHVKDGYLAPLDPNFGGCGRAITGEDGAYAFRTVRPGPYPWPNGPNDWRPAHVHFSLFGSGLAQRLVTQMYFEGDPLIARCPIADTIPDARDLERLVARLDMDAARPHDALAYRFDLVLRGRRRTPLEEARRG